jgi:hypothetical protein
MQMDEGSVPGEEGSEGPEEDRDRRDGRGEKIGVGGGDDAVTRIQLAARWAESFPPDEGDSLVGMLKRFRVAYEYLDAVLHGVEPSEPEMPEVDSRPVVSAAAPAYSPPSPPPAPPPSEPQGGEPRPEAQPEPRPWA